MSSEVNINKSVVFIPRALCSDEIFADQISGISPPFNAVLIDTRQTKTITEMAKTILAQAPVHFSLVGISMGGYVALEVLRIAPDRVWGVVLISTSARAEMPDQAEERKRWIDRIESGQYEDFVDEIVDDCISSKVKLNNARERFHEMVKAYSIDTISRQMSACAMRPDFQKSLKDIKCPLLLIGGSDDSEFFLNGHKEISVKVIYSEILILPNCGHLPTIESPIRTTNAIKKFLVKAEKSLS